MNLGQNSALFMDNGLGYKPEVHFDVISPNEYGSTDTFSLTDKDNSNYFWKWFKKLNI